MYRKIGPGEPIITKSEHKGELTISKITVIDAPCGAGKTSWVIQEINNHPERSYIYCTPFLDEIGRVREKCGEWRISEPHNFDSTKIDDFNDLLSNGKEIAVTHSTFLNATPETMEYIKQGDYTLIIDEVLEVVCEFNKTTIAEQHNEQKMKKGDIQMLLDGPNPYIEVDEKTGLVKWVRGEYDGKFTEVQRLAKLNRLYLVRGKMLVCLFPPEIFQMFKSVYVLTYLFEGSVLKPYLEAFGLEWEVASVTNEAGVYSLCEYSRESDIAFRTRCSELITHYWPDKMKPEFKATALSKRWYIRNHAEAKIVDRVRNKISNFVRHTAKAASKDVMWTCPKDYEKIFSGKGYTNTFRVTSKALEPLAKKEKDKLIKQASCFVPCNAKATNIYGDRSTLIYCCNMYPNGMLEEFWEDCGGVGVKLNKDMFALSCLIQWVFRSRIRNGEPIHIYILSHRMATLFDEWLKCEI